MPLLLQIAVVLGGSALVTLAIGRRRGRTGLATGAVVAVVLLAAVLTLVTFGERLGWFASRSQGYATYDVDGAERRAAHRAGLSPTWIAFPKWIERKLRPGDTYAVLPPHDREPDAAYSWLTYRLLPHLPVDDPRAADVVVFLDLEREWVRIDRRRFGPWQEFARGAAIVMRRDAR